MSSFEEEEASYNDMESEENENYEKDSFVVSDSEAEESDNSDTQKKRRLHRKKVPLNILAARPRRRRPRSHSRAQSPQKTRSSQKNQRILRRVPIFIIFYYFFTLFYPLVRKKPRFNLIPKDQNKCRRKMPLSVRCSRTTFRNPWKKNNLRHKI
jgi:hypothetical protein